MESFAPITANQELIAVSISPRNVNNLKLPDQQCVVICIIGPLSFPTPQKKRGVGRRRGKETFLKVQTAGKAPSPKI